jgi:hypothetical protein
MNFLMSSLAYRVSALWTFSISTICKEFTATCSKMSTNGPEFFER